MKMQASGQVERLRDVLQGGASAAAEEIRFYGQAAVELNKYLVPMENGAVIPTCCEWLKNLLARAGEQGTSVVALQENGISSFIFKRGRSQPDRRKPGSAFLLPRMRFLS
jgi:hypothetical protein